jgi:hypothetical protein
VVRRCVRQGSASSRNGWSVHPRTSPRQGYERPAPAPRPACPRMHGRNPLYFARPRFAVGEAAHDAAAEGATPVIAQALHHRERTLWRDRPPGDGRSAGAEGARSRRPQGPASKLSGKRTEGRPACGLARHCGPLLP